MARRVEVARRFDPADLFAVVDRAFPWLLRPCGFLPWVVFLGVPLPDAGFLAPVPFGLLVPVPLAPVPWDPALLAVFERVF